VARFSWYSAASLALGYAALSLAVLALFATPLWYAWRSNIGEGRAEVLREDSQRLSEVFRNKGVAGLVTAIDDQVGTQLIGNKFILLTDGAHSRLSGNLPAWPAGVPQRPGLYNLSIELAGATVPAALEYSTLPGGYNLLVGHDTARFRPLEAVFWIGLAAAATVVVLVSVLGVALIRRSLLARVHVINRTASAIVRGHLASRLPTRGGADEFDILAQTVNLMLDQIEQLIHGVRNVSDAIAHDLRTPLAELRSRLEELTLTRPSAEETFAEIDTAVADVDRVIAIFNALLRLAEIDTGARRSGFVLVDVAKVAGEVAEFYQPAAELRGVAFSFHATGELMVAGDCLLLAQAIGNLIENALKYAQDNGTIAVTAALRPDAAIEVAVADDGPGIPDSEKSRVTERFYRGDASRGTPGAGLGLSLVASVVRLHDGWLELSDNNPGLRAALILVQADRFGPSPALTAA
jgi:signal transduction histidine kinase